MKPLPSSSPERKSRHSFLTHCIFCIALVLVGLSLDWNDLSWQVNQRTYFSILTIVLLWGFVQVRK